MAPRKDARWILTQGFVKQWKVARVLHRRVAFVAEVIERELALADIRLGIELQDGRPHAFVNDAAKPDGRVVAKEPQQAVGSEPRPGMQIGVVTYAIRTGQLRADFSEVPRADRFIRIDVENPLAAREVKSTIACCGEVVRPCKFMQANPRPYRYLFTVVRGTRVYDYGFIDQVLNGLKACAKELPLVPDNQRSSE